jgi:hypothetical protein
MAQQRSSRRAQLLGRSTVAAFAVALAVASGSHALATPSDTDHDASTVESQDFGTLAQSDLDVLQGEQAVDHLESSGALDEVAVDAGLAPEELVDELIEDPALFVTESGFVGYADTLDHDPHHGDDSGLEGDAHHDDDGDARHLDAGSVAAAAAVTAAALPANVFDLNSRPSSNRVLYLDFDGHSANDPAWAGVGYPGSIVSAPFDIDGVPGFSATEQGVIFEVWRRVAEDYRAFDLNVTTRDPGTIGSCRTPVGNLAAVQRVVISPSNFTGQAGVIGVALLNVFGSGVDHAAYVFTDSVLKQLPKTMGEAVSHEAGHTFGLRHDGAPGSPEYYDGHGAWAPIMGRSVSASTPVTQWSKGEYAGANRQEDDLAIIALLAGYRPDDHGDSAASPTVVPSNSVNIGNIGRTGDRDVFAVDVLAGALSVQLRPPAGEAAWSNLAASLTVRDSAGAVVASAGPTVPSDWVVDLAPAVPEGRYTLEVEPVGWLTASTGFTTYGSLGAYQLVVSAQQGLPPAGAGASTFTPVLPTRLVDTRNGVGATGRIETCRQVVVQVTGAAAVPATATAAVINVAAVNPSSPGFVTVYPCSGSVPDTSTLNFVAGQTVANTTIAALSSAGQLCVWTFADTDILVDITGWIGPGGTSRLTPIGPTRVVDTRSGVGGVRLGAGSTMAVDFNGVVPAGSNAVALNVTGVTASAPGFITVYPCGGSVPNTSTVNYVAGEAKPNNTIVGLSAGQVCIYSDQSTEILVDLLGAFGPSGLAYQPTPPIRVLDTRNTGTLRAGEAVRYVVGAAALAGQVPGAAYVNVTAANHLVPGYVTTYDCVTRRDTSTLNQKVGQATANGAIVPLSALQSCGWTYGGGDLIVDLNGWWVP